MDEQNQFQQTNPQPSPPPPNLQTPASPAQPNIMPAQPEPPQVPQVPQQTYPPAQPIVSDFSPASAVSTSPETTQPQTGMQPVYPTPQQGLGQPSPAAQPQPVMPMSQSQMTSVGMSKPKNNKLKFLLVILAGVVLLGGGSAAAYFGVVVPNKPENRLAAGVKNMLQSDEWTATGTSEVSGGGSFGSVKAESVTQYDRQAKAMAMKSTVTVGGIKVPFELRYIDKSAYVKIDDLTAIKNLLSAGAPEYAPLVSTIEQKIVKQWVEIDSTIYKPLDIDCLLFTKPTSKDTSNMLEVFTGKGIATIKSSSTETVNGQKTSKYVLDIDEKKLDALGNDLQNSSYVKKALACVQDKSSTTDKTQIGDQEKKVTQELQDATLDMTVWLDGSNNIRQFAMTTDDKSGKLEMTTQMDYRAVNIVKPTGAKPVVEVLADLGSSLNGVLGQSVERYLPGIEN